MRAERERMRWRERRRETHRVTERQRQRKKKRRRNREVGRVQKSEKVRKSDEMETEMRMINGRTTR